MSANTQQPFELITREEFFGRRLEQDVEAIAIDPPGTTEVDDAIHVRMRDESEGGGADITVYVADASCIQRDPELIDQAERLGFSHYELSPNQLMYPDYVLSELSLENDSGYGAPAVAIRIRADEAGTALTGVELVRVHVRATTYGDFAKMVKKQDPGALAIAYGTRFINNPEKSKKQYSYSCSSHRIVAEYMRLANIKMAHDAAQKGLPWIYREYHPPKGLHGGTGVFRAQYVTEPMPHDCANGGYYTHFTSPLRRRVDTLLHMMRRAHTMGEDYPYSRDDLAQIADRVNVQMSSLGHLALTA